MAAAELAGLGGLHTLEGNPARVILTDNPREADALAELTPANPRVWFPGLAQDASLDALAGREVVVWVSRPTPAYWLAGSAVAWLRRLLTITTNVSVVCADDATGPRKHASAEPLGAWLSARLKPATDVLPSNVTPIKAAPPARAQPSAVPLTEDALLAAYTARHPHTRYVGLWGSWLQWDGARWHDEKSGRVLDYVYQSNLAEADKALADGATATQYSRCRTERTRASIEKLARTSRAHASVPDDWDADLFAICTPGGIVDLRTGELRPATPTDYVTKQTRNTPRGTCPRWRQFLAEATGGDVDLQIYLQRIAGYMLTGSAKEECFFFAYGQGGNGKGTYINTLTHILGDYAKAASMDVFMESKSDRHSTEIASLRGARMVSAQETEEGRRWAEGKLKTMTGSDPLSARLMHQDFFEFMPQFKLILAGNNKPQLRSLDDAMRRRLNLIPFTAKFEGAKRDSDLKAKLIDEGDGILAWAVQGCVDWYHSGLRPPSAVTRATADYFEDQDIVRHWVNDCCEIDANAWGGSQALYNSFREWAKDCGETYIMPLKRFRERLITMGHAAGRVSSGARFEGIKLADSLTMRRGYQADMPGFE